MVGLDPDSVLARIKESGQPVLLPNLKQSLTVGTLGFTIVSVLMFGVWAVGGRWLQQELGDLLFYSVLAVGFMAGGGGVFKPILIGENLGRFYGLFVGSFFVYAAVWTLCWFKVPNYGEWLATVLGPAAMGLMFAWSFGAPGQRWRCVAGLVVGHTAGYFVGSWLFALEPLHNRFGMLLWGVTYGAGFGAGISFALFLCQTANRTRLQAMLDPQASNAASNQDGEGHGPPA